MEYGKLRVIISGGGTGGHIFPALSIANKLKELNPETEVLFVVQKEGWRWRRYRLQAIRS